MKINKLEIKGFGRFERQNLVLKNGLNIIYGDNETGKSTVQWFIKGMLFGLKGGRSSREGLQPPLKRFKPWRGNDFSGSLEYSLDNGDTFRVERDFSSNSAKIYDSYFNDITNTFEIAKDKGPKIIEKQLGINENCFDRTIFIRQMETRLDEDGGKELLARLTNISQTGFEEVSFKKAEDALKEAIKINVGTGKTTTRPMDLLISRLNELKDEKKRLEEKREFFNVIEKELKEALEIKNGLDEKLKDLNGKKECLSLQIDYKRNLSKRSVLNELLKKISDADVELKAVKEKGFSNNSADTNVKKILKSDEIEKSLCNARNKRKLYSKLSAFFLMVSIIAFITGCFKGFIGYLTGGLFIIPSIVFFILLNLTANKIFRLLEDKRSALSALDESSITLNLSNQRIKDVEDKIKGYFFSFSSICGIQCGEMKQLYEVMNNISTDIGMLEMKMNNLKAANLKNDIGVNNPENIEYEEKINLELVKTETEYREIILKIKENETLLKSINNENDGLQRLEEEIEDLLLKKNQLEGTEYSLKKALEVMTAASLELQKDFIPTLSRTMSKTIARISGGRYSDLRVDSTLALKALAPEINEVITAAQLSGGTTDQMHLALRVASAELLSLGNEKLFYIMDEIFAQYDDTRTLETLNYLGELASERQIILFTCKSREIDLASKVFGQNANLMKLEI